MTPYRLRLFGSMLLLCVGTAVRAGPAEIAGLQQQLATADTQIAQTQARMRRALDGYGGTAGEEGARLRALKLERTQIQAQLRQALAAQKARESMDLSMPSPPPVGDPRQAQGQREKALAAQGTPGPKR